MLHYLEINKLNLEYIDTIFKDYIAILQFYDDENNSDVEILYITLKGITYFLNSNDCNDRFKHIFIDQGGIETLFKLTDHQNSNFSDYVEKVLEKYFSELMIEEDILN